jgi:hypothetical protein
MIEATLTGLREVPHPETCNAPWQTLGAVGMLGSSAERHA